MAKQKNNREAKNNREVAAEAEGWIAAGPYCIVDCAGEVVATFAGVDKAANRAFVLTACRNREALTRKYEALTRKYEALAEAAKLAAAALNEAQSEWVAVSETYAPEWTHPLKQAADALGDALASVAAEGEVTRG